MISYQFRLSRLALLSFLVVFSCSQKGRKASLDIEDGDTNNQILVETKSSRAIRVGSLSLVKIFQKQKLAPNLKAYLF